MKRIILGSTVLLLTSLSVSYAQKIMVASNRQAALASCQEKAKASPENLRQKMLSSCQCIVGKTDFELANQLNQSGKTKELQALYEKAAKACQ